VSDFGVTEFVDECRREWRRLRVPDAVANEMAADLAADLNEAEVEGVSPEEVLGSGAFDPRAFAASWAAERGLIGLSPRTPFGTLPSRPRWSPVSLGVVAGLGAMFAVVVLVVGLVGIGSVSQAHSSAPIMLATTRVPDLLGLDLASATSAARVAGLAPQITYRSGTRAESGVVVDQVPQPGSLL
jgi:hypothetical protein